MPQPPIALVVSAHSEIAGVDPEMLQRAPPFDPWRSLADPSAIDVTGSKSRMY
jgi:hypothetical protein